MKHELPFGATRGHSLKPLALAMVCLGLAPALAQTLPTGFSAVMGGVSMAQPSASTMNIQQSTARAIAQWNSFSIGAGATVNVAQPGAASVLLNRVVGNELSTIAGRLNANGHVYLVNPNGVLFSKGSSVNVGGLVASTLDVSNASFMAGKQLVFERAAGNNAAVVNAGSITASDGGTVALMGADVRNEGSINVARGTVGLLSGRRIAMDFEGDGLTTFRIDADSLAGSATVENAAGAVIAADGGRVVIAADAASVGQRVVNQAGTVRARTLAGRNGEIVLGGGATNDVHVTGALDATGAAAGEKGGRIDVASNRILLDGGLVDASGAAGGGDIKIHATDMAVITGGTTLRSSATVDGDGGRIVALGDNGLRAHGQFVARGAGDHGEGGFVETSGHALDVSGARVDTSAPSGRAGTWLLDPFDVIIIPGEVGVIPAPAPPGTTVFEPVEAEAATTFSDGDINLALTTTNVTVTTGKGGSDLVGDITFADGVAIQYGGGAARTFRLEANQDIVMATPTAKASIVSTGAPLNVEFIADINKAGIPVGAGIIRIGGRVEYTGTITTNGGDVTMQGFSTGALCAVCLSSAAIDTRSATAPIGGAVNLLALQGDVSVAAASSINTGTGTVSLTGDGVRILANSSINTTSGAVNITGTGSGNIGVSITDSTIGTANGDIDISGTALGEGGDGVAITGSTLGTAGGKLGITGTGDFGDGVSIDTSTLTSGTGDLSIVGTGSFANGVLIGANTTVGTTGGDLSIVGTGNFGAGVLIGANANVSTTQGNLSIAGTGDQGNSGVSIDTSTLTSGAGDLSITGLGAAGGEGGGGAGVAAQASTIGSTTGAINITGTGGNNAGVNLFAGSKVSTTSGIMSITGTGDFDNGVTITNSSLETGSGQINVTGTGDFFTGVTMFGSNIVATGAGSVSILGTGIDSTGVSIFGDPGSVTVQTQGGDIGITGIATLPLQGVNLAANGLEMNGGSVQSADGNIALRGLRAGAASTGDGVALFNGTHITTTGAGNIEVTGEAAGSGAGVRLSSVAPDSGGDLVSLAAFVPLPAPASFVFSNHNALVRATNDGSTDALVLDGSLAANGVLNLRPGGVDIAGIASDRAGNIALGAAAATGFAISDAELPNLFGGTVVVGSSAHVGNIDVLGAWTSDAAVTLQNGGGGNIVLNAPLSALQVGLLSAGNITQAGNGAIAADSMLARSTGGFVLLDNPANDVGIIGGGAVGRFEFRNANALAVAPVSVTGIDAASDQPVLASSTAGAGLNGSDVRVETGAGDLNIAAGVVASGNVVLRTLAAGDLHVDAGVSGSKVALEAAGSVIQGFGGGSVNPGGQLLAPGDTTPIVATSLLVQADGDVSMTNPSNRVGTLAGSAGGRFDYADADALTVGAVTVVDRQQALSANGISAKTVRVRTVDGNMSVASGIAAGQSALLQAGGAGSLALNAGVQAKDIALLAGGSVLQSGPGAVTATQLFASGQGDVRLLNTGNLVGTVAGSAGGRFDYAQAGALKIGSFAGTDALQPVTGSGIGGANVRVETQGADLTVEGPVAATGNAVLQTLGTGNLQLAGAVSAKNLVLGAAGNITQIVGPGGAAKPGGAQLQAPGDTTPITATSLLARSTTGDVSLTNPNNRVGTIAGGATGRFDYANADALTVGTVTLSDRQQTLSGTGITAETVRLRTFAEDLTLSAGVASTAADLIAGARFQNPAGVGAPATGNWRIWANTWLGENRGGLAGSGTFPNYYNCAFGGFCGVNVAPEGNHFIYVQRPVLTVTVDSGRRLAGEINPPLGFTSTGLILGDTGAGVAGSVGTAAGVASPAGVYAVNGSFSSAEGYAINVIPGQLIVAPLPSFMKPEVVREAPTTWLYDRNIGQAPICFATGPLAGDPTEQGADVLAREWSRVRSRPNLLSCVDTEKRNGCADF